MPTIFRSSPKLSASLSLVLLLLIGSFVISTRTAFSVASKEAATDRGLHVATAKTRQLVSANYGRLPLHFEATQAPAPAAAKFRARGAGYDLSLSGAEAVLKLRAKHAVANVSLKLVGAAPTPHVEGLEALPGKLSYFTGSDARAWRTQVPSYAKVRSREVYPGVDVVYYGKQRQLEYDFIVAPGADVKMIRLAFAGVAGLRVDAQGDLVLTTAAGELRQHKPVIYQEVAGRRREIAGGYVIGSRNEVGVRVAAYDRRCPLVIDPMLSYATLLGGSLSDEATAIAVDAEGSAYITGHTISADFLVQESLRAAAPRDTFFRSEQSGATWQASSSALGGLGIRQFVIVPPTPATIYASTLRGIFKSTDRGVTWSLLNKDLVPGSGLALTLALDAGNPNVLYAGGLLPAPRSTRAPTAGERGWKSA